MHSISQFGWVKFEPSVACTPIHSQDAYPAEVSILADRRGGLIWRQHRVTRASPADELGYSIISSGA
jgi:hypothetical protein